MEYMDDLPINTHALILALFGMRRVFRIEYEMRYYLAQHFLYYTTHFYCFSIEWRKYDFIVYF